MKEFSHLVPSQFPSFYREHGPNFIAFIKAYYEWLEEEEGINSQGRNLLRDLDIDTTTEKFLKRFREKYMAGIPDDILGNQKLLHKHIVDLYRSKGSEQGIKLLFRLLYNEDIDIYVPHYDIFNTSDNTWIEPRYFEVTVSTHTNLLQNQFIWGASSGATAIVEGIERKITNGSIVHLIFVSNISGEFIVGEPIHHGGMDESPPPRIKGSPVELEVLSSTDGFSVGEMVYESEKQLPVSAVVTETYFGTGIITFDIVDGGSYYSMDTVINISTGANTTGTGAHAVIGSIANTFPFVYSSEYLEPYANVALDATTYGFSNTSANASTIIADSLDLVTTLVGTISSIEVINPGINYDNYVNVEAVDPHTSTRGIVTPTGYGGLNADITGNAVSGDGLVSSLKVWDSSYNFNEDGEIIQLFEETNMRNITARVKTGPIGHHPGFFDNTKSFASSDKYLYDGHYYQDFSYEIRSLRVLDDYREILTQLVHMSGNALYGGIKIYLENRLNNKIGFYDLVQTQY